MFGEGIRSEFHMFFCMEVEQEWDVILKMVDEPQVVHPTKPGGLVVILMLPPFSVKLAS